MSQTSQSLPAPSPADIDYVHKVVEASGSSFTAGMRVLPKPRREAMYAIYAFCREVDDIADEPGPIDLRLSQLDDWRAEINHLYEGKPGNAVSRALMGPVAAYELPREEFLAVIDGMEMDLRSALCGPPMDELELYCRRVAGAVGMLSIHAFGAEEPEARNIAVVLGEAFQYTNILRDIWEDALIDRLYLPRELLDKHGIDTSDPKEVAKHPNLPAVAKELAATARERYATTRELMTHCKSGPLKPIIMMMAVYERILHKLEASGWRDIETRVSLSLPQKVWVAIRYGLF